MRTALTLLFFCLSLGVRAEGAFYAAQLGDANLHRLPAGGMDAIGGRGDWFLTDGATCAVISGADHPTYLSLHGASLVDLWHCDRANDQWSSSHAQLNLQKDQIPVTQSISAGYDLSGAWIETRATREGLDVVVRYSLAGTSPGVLAVDTKITRTGNGDRLGMFGSLVLHPRGSLNPFTLDTRGREYSRGLDQLRVNTADFSSILGSVAVADLQVLLGSRQIQPSISYGLHSQRAVRRTAKGEEDDLHLFQLGGRDFTLVSAFTQPFPGWWSRAPGPVSFLAGQLFDLDMGERFVLQQTITLGSGDAAGITDTLYDGPTLSGYLDTPEAGITVVEADGVALSFARPAADGRFSLRLPADVAAVRLLIETPWGDLERAVSIRGDTDLGAIASGATGTLRLPRQGPMNLVFEATHFRPVFHHALASGRIAGERVLSGPESYRLTLSGTVHDLPEVRLPPGRYRVLASRGPEYGVTRAQVDIVADAVTSLVIQPPPRALDSPGQVSADLHLHSGMSFDGSLSPVQRVIDFIAQGAEVLVATEHNVTYDIAPTVRDMGLSQHILALPGVEITGMVRTEATPTTIAHSNVFPVPADPAAFMGGTLPFEGQRLGQVIGAYKARYPGSVYQLNHPRELSWDDDIAFFNHLSQGVAYDPAKPLTEWPNVLLLEQHDGSAYRDIDFDAMELLNGDAMDLYEMLRTDWFSLLQQGHYKVITANSDSHQSSQVVAYPRNMLVVDRDDPAQLDAATVAAAIAGGRLYGTTGPLLEVALSGVGPGQTLVGERGELSVLARCADWVDVDEARIWVNGTLHGSYPLVSGEPLTVPLSFDADSFVFVEVSGPASPTYQAIVPGYAPFAFANPVFVDTQGDGWRYGQSPPEG